MKTRSNESGGGGFRERRLKDDFRCYFHSVLRLARDPRHGGRGTFYEVRAAEEARPSTRTGQSRRGAQRVREVDEGVAGLEK